MKKLFSFVMLNFLFCIALNAQTAVDFTANDCNSTSHNLFTELNNGKVIVLVWVMPCSACISDAKAAYDAAQSFATSNPGKVLYWLSDDNGGSSCSSLNNWATTNSIGPNMTVFGNSGNTIKESDYGGSAMPHVVVIGGTNHHVFINLMNGSNDGTAITAAIASALAAGVNDVPAVNNLSVYPNPTSNNINISFTMPQTSDVQVDVLDFMGKLVKSFNYKQLSGTQTLPINFNNNLPEGNYLLRIKTNQGVSTNTFTITH